MDSALNDYWEMGDDELYALLGAALLGTRLGVSPEEQDRDRRFGKQWLERQTSELRRRICTDKRVRGLLGTTTSDRFIDAVTIAQLLGEHDDYAINAPLIAVLLARVGLGTFCANLPGGA